MPTTKDELCPLQWRHNGHDGISNHQPHDCLLNHLFRRRSKKTSKLRVTGLWVGNSPGTGEFSTQMASNVENVSIWWCHHAKMIPCHKVIIHTSTLNWHRCLKSFLAKVKDLLVSLKGVVTSVNYGCDLKDQINDFYHSKKFPSRQKNPSMS